MKIFKNVLALVLGLFISFALAEIILRIYNPVPSRFRGDKIQLKTNFKKKIIIEPKIAGLDSVIDYSLNSLGFRGPEKPENPAFLIITVGGSTTECSLLDDKKTWSFLLGKKLNEKCNDFWVNNAGIDGCTTYGHNILLDDYLIKLKPNMILFLIGINDRGRTDFGNEDGFLIERRESYFKKLFKKSELICLLGNLYDAYKTKKINIGHGKKTAASEKQTKILAIEEKKNKTEKHLRNLPAYKNRVEMLVKKCVRNNIVPVLMTQPLLDNSFGWEIIQLYNEETKLVSAGNKILCIDLANELEKDEKYFYDNMHYSNAGAERISEIIAQHLSAYFDENKQPQNLK